jgi:hypothetical protein
LSFHSNSGSELDARERLAVSRVDDQRHASVAGERVEALQLVE